MKTSKIIIAFCLILFIFISFSGLFVLAIPPETTVSLVARDKTVEIGGKVIIDVMINNALSDPIQSGDIKVSYESNDFTYQKTDNQNVSITSGVNLITIKFDNSEIVEEQKICTLEFIAENAGEFNFNLNNVVLNKAGGSLSSIIKENEIVAIQSNDASLKALEVAEAQLNKPFSKDVYNYSLSVKNSVTRINVTAIPNDENAKVIYSGTTGLKAGEENIVKITVTAPAGNTKTYTLTVTRAGETSSSSSRSSQRSTSVSMAQYSSVGSATSQVSSAAAPKTNNEEDTPLGLLIIVAILCTGFGGLGGYVIREYLYKKNKG